mmetsp:Transcript_48638/g.155373  ORF Transcript_48638/g.155373 Transcript_48638/m.155373 type:complete len:211 (+) Transcript_48638:213-845(+)
MPARQEEHLTLPLHADAAGDLLPRTPHGLQLAGELPLCLKLPGQEAALRLAPALRGLELPSQKLPFLLHGRLRVPQLLPQPFTFLFPSMPRVLQLPGEARTIARLGALRSLHRCQALRLCRGGQPRSLKALSEPSPLLSCGPLCRAQLLDKLAPGSQPRALGNLQLARKAHNGALLLSKRCARERRAHRLQAVAQQLRHTVELAHGLAHL